MGTVKREVRPESYLSLPDFKMLNWACRALYDSFGCPAYLVGSVLTRPDFRDIDLRLPMDGLAVDKPAVSFHNDLALSLVNIAISRLLSNAANTPVPVDFQLQTQAKFATYDGELRNPMGVAW